MRVNGKPDDLVELDLRHLICEIWAGKWLIIAVTTAAAVISVVVALMLPDVYRSEALLAPNDQHESGGITGILSQYQGLAALAGMGGGSGSVDRTTISIEMLQSRKFISDFIDRRNVLVPLLAAKRWDTGTGELVIDPDIYDVDTEQWVRDVSPPRTVIPSAPEAYKAFSDLLSVNRDRKTGLVTVSVEHFSPILAKRWVDWLVQDLNLTIMKQDVREAEQAIRYLNEKIQQTSLAGLQSVFFNLIEQQTKVVMLASISPEYVFKILDPAVVPDRKAKPHRSIIAIAGTTFGGLIAVIFVLLLSRLSA